MIEIKIIGQPFYEIEDKHQKGSKTIAQQD
jgi:hypothetical protein